MAKLSQKAPDTFKTVVKLDSTTAEVWFCPPISLGIIQYKDNCWFTKDDMRFMSSRDAMEYLIKIHTMDQRYQQQQGRQHQKQERPVQKQEKQEKPIVHSRRLPKAKAVTPVLKAKNKPGPKPKPVVRESAVQSILEGVLAKNPELRQYTRKEKEQLIDALIQLPVRDV